MKRNILLPLLFLIPLSVSARPSRNDLVAAITAEDAPRAAQILALRPSLAKSKYRGSPLIFYAVALPGTNMASLLLGAGAPVNARAKNGLTPLLWAIINKNEALVRLLLEKKADPAALDRENVGALSYAVQSGDRALVSLMMRYRLDPFTPDRRGKTPFIYASELKDPVILKMIDEYHKVRKIYDR